MAWVRYGGLSEHYRNGATYFASVEAQNLKAIAEMEGVIADAENRGDLVEASRLQTYFVPQARKYTERASRMRRHYEHAASHPWETLPIELRRRPFPH